MSAVGLHILERETCLAELIPEVGVSLVEEVGVSAADPEVGRFLADVGGKLGVEILLHRAGLLVAYTYGRREHA